MFRYAIRRVLTIVPTMVGISLVTFVIIQLAPGDPVQASQRGQMLRISKSSYDELRSLYGLDKPILTQYRLWVERILTLDFGESFTDHQPVLRKIGGRIGPTLYLNVASLILSFGIAVPLGIYAALNRGTFADKASGAVTYLLYSLPSYWVALLLILLVGVKLDLLPFYGIESDFAESMTLGERVWDRALHMVLPVICLTYGSLAYISRFLRGTMLEVMDKDYIRTARAKGVSGFGVLVHALRNALIPLITMFALILPTLASGSIILEYIFSWPGLGQLYFESVLGRDYPTIMGLSTITAVLVLAANLFADLMYAVVDPRVTYE